MASDSHDLDLCFGDYRIALSDERLVGPHGPVRLGRKAFLVLLRLAEREGQLVTKDSLFESVWDGLAVSESALTSVIKELRRALDDRPVDPIYIQSVYGRGYRFLPPIEHRPAGGTTRPRPSSPERADAVPLGEAPVLAVPPFDDIAVVDTDRHLGAVLHEEMVVALSRFRDLRLVASAGETPAQAGGAPDRLYRLDVRLLRDGDAIRAFARVTRLATGAIIWADQIHLPANNPLEAVDNLARRVAGVALPRLHDDLLRNVPDKAGDAFDQYYQLRLRMRSLEGMDDAREIASAWERLIAAYPDLVQAYPQLIRLYHTDYCFNGLGATDMSERRRAYELAHRALAMDPTDSHLHTVKGWCHLWAAEAGLAARHFDEAARLNPYHQARLIELATGFMFLDDLDRAAQLLERWRAIAVFSTEAPHEEEGLLHLLRGHPALAAESLSLARCTHPDDDRATVRPSVMTDFYALLAATGANAPDRASRAERWRALVAGLWAGPQPLDDARLVGWIISHNPFQKEERREWLRELTLRALDANDQAVQRTPSPAHPETQSAPSGAAPEL